MKIKNIFYIGVALLLAGCANETELISNTLSGEGKTPLTIRASLTTGRAETRAAGKEFAQGDKLLAYIRHVNNTNESNVTAYTSIAADQAPRLVTFTKGSAAMADKDTSDGIKETSDLTASYTSTSNSTVSALYWDDFSVSDVNLPSGYGDNDLRKDGHGLQSYYGYCYNGKTGVSLTNETAGTLTWTVATDQSTSATVVQNQDLLWSPAQTAVTYAHSTAREASTTVTHGELTIPYTHAMSEVTITVKAVEGFDGENDPLASTALTLYGAKTETALTAPSSTFSTTQEETAEIKMYAETYTAKSLTRDFTAIVAPGTTFTQGQKLLDIKGVDGNNYTLTIIANMLTTDTWAKDHSSDQYGTDANSKQYVIAQPGVNYHLEVTVNKTSIQTKATLADWKEVNATGTGEIVFDNDDTNLVMDDTQIPSGKNGVSVVAVDKNTFVSGATFSLFTLESTTTNAEATARTNESYTFATVSKFKDNADDANDEWVNTPEIYWPNNTSNYYFRALAKFNSCENDINNISSVGTYANDKGVSVSQGTITDGKDILWGTTAKHKGSTNNTTYGRGQAIPPRTGGVPIAFEHAMSKITVNLETTTGSTEATIYNSTVDLTDATIAISNLYTSGTILIESGTIEYTDGNKTAAAISQVAPISNLIVIPQTIIDDAKVTVTLKDGTVFSLKLKECKDNDTGNAITEWVRGKHYTYTIHLEKEKMTFRALIKDWETATGSGNATLEWD